MNFLRDIFEDKQDQEYIHHKFVKYGRGEHAGPVAVIKKTHGVIKINASGDYANILGAILLKSSDCDVAAKGNIIAPEDLSEKLDASGIEVTKTRKKKKTTVHAIKYMGPAETLLEAYVQHPEATFLLDLKSGKNTLKTKNTPPKLGSKINDSFCKTTINVSAEEYMLEELCFGTEIEHYEEIKISHSYSIQGFMIPEQYKNNPLMTRIHAKRKGTIKRTVEVDGSASGQEKELLA